MLSTVAAATTPAAVAAIPTPTPTPTPTPKADPIAAATKKRIAAAKAKASKADPAAKVVEDWAKIRRDARDAAQEKYTQGKTFAEILAKPDFDYTFRTAEGPKTATATVDLRALMDAKAKAETTKICALFEGFAMQVITEESTDHKPTRNALFESCKAWSETVGLGVCLSKKDIVTISRALPTIQRKKGTNATLVKASGTWRAIYNALVSRAHGMDIAAVVGRGKSAHVTPIACKED